MQLLLPESCHGAVVQRCRSGARGAASLALRDAMEIGGTRNVDSRGRGGTGAAGAHARRAARRQGEKHCIWRMTCQN